MNLLEKRFGGHKTIRLLGWRITIYGFNAMHVAINIATYKWGYICFHPTIWFYGRVWPWYFYVSPNATPWAATFAIGPGVNKQEKARTIIRRREFGHNFNTDKNYTRLCEINGVSPE